MFLSVATQKDPNYVAVLTSRDEALKKNDGRGESRPIFKGWGRFRLKWRFPLFLHPSPLYSSEWVTHCNYRIYKLAPLHFLYTAFYAVDFALYC